MAKPKGRPKTSNRNDVTVRMNKALVHMARAIAVSRGVPVGAVLDEIAGAAIRRAYIAMLRENDAGEGGGR